MRGTITTTATRKAQTSRSHLENDDTHKATTTRPWSASRKASTTEPTGSSIQKCRSQCLSAEVPYWVRVLRPKSQRRRQAKQLFDCRPQSRLIHRSRTSDSLDLRYSLVRVPVLNQSPPLTFTYYLQAASCPLMPSSPRPLLFNIISSSLRVGSKTGTKPPSTTVVLDV